MAITITQAHATKTSTPGRIYDTHPGLHLWVKSAKAKYWIFRTSRGGKRTDLSLGSFPMIGVAEARKKASELASQVTQLGGLPKKAKALSQNLEKPQGMTFDEFARGFVADMSPEWKNVKHASQWVSTLRDYASPIIGNKPINEVVTEDILQILKPIWLTKTETATRLRGRIERVLAAATTMGLRQGVNPALWRGHLDCLLPKPKRFQKVRHHPALSYKEIPSFMETLRSRSGVSALALEFCILTATRTSEVLLAKRSEFNEALWTVPAERMKARKEHLVHLSNRANQLVKKAIALDPTSEFVFSNHGHPLSNMSLLNLLKRMNFKHVTTHGFRSTFRDWVSEETSFSSEVAEMCLAHTITNKVEAAYRRGNLFDKRKTLYEAWSSFCNNKQNDYQHLRVA